MKMYPPVRRSRVIARRRMVVLPEPDGPMRVTRSPRSTEKFRSFSTVLSPNRFSTSRNSMTGGVVSDSVGVGKTFLQSIDEHGRDIAGNQKDHAGNGNSFDIAVGKPTNLQGCGHHLHD